MQRVSCIKVSMIGGVHAIYVSEVACMHLRIHIQSNMFYLVINPGVSCSQDPQSVLPLVWFNPQQEERHLAAGQLGKQ